MEFMLARGADKTVSSSLIAFEQKLFEMLARIHFCMTVPEEIFKMFKCV